MTKEVDELISIREAAKMLGVHPSTLRNWDRAGRLKAVRVGSRRDRRFKKADVLAEAQAQRRDELVTAKDPKQAARMVPQDSIWRASIAEMAKALGTTPRGLQEIVATQGSIREAYLAEIAKELGTTPAGLNEIVTRCQAAVDRLGPFTVADNQLRDSIAHAMAVMDPMRAVDSLFKDSFAELHAGLSESVARFGELFEPILWEQKLFGDHMRDYLASMSEALPSKLYQQFAATQAELFSTQAIAGLAGSFEVTGIAEAASLLSQQMTANIGAYQDFSRVALWDLDARGEASDKRLPFAELKLAGGLLASATSLAAGFRTRAGEAGTTAVRKPNVFRYFHAEARQVAATEALNDGELEAQLRAVKSFRASNAGLGVAEACGRINRMAQLRRQDPIFRPSVNAVTTGARLVLSFAGDEAEFGEVVDGLYEFIFEASGGGHRLRALAEPDEYSAVDDIVVLRNYWRHDPAQKGSVDDSRRRSGRVGDVFERLAGKRLPCGPADWHRACLALMQRVEGCLRAIADRFERQE